MTRLLITCCLALGLAVYLPAVRCSASEDTGAPLEKRAEDEPSTWKEGYTSLKAELKKTQAALAAIPDSKARSTYIRWGRKKCNKEKELVYTGVTGGSHYTHKGGAANAVCLTNKPQHGNSTIKPPYSALVYGTEYEHIVDHHNQNVPCAVCRIRKATTIMIPGTQTCTPDWKVEYKGYLVAGYYAHAAASEYLCVDGEPEDLDGGNANHNGHLFYYTKAKCGSLACPPYVQDAIVTCVVCSK